MAIKDRWTELRKNLGRLLLGHGGGYGADTFVRGIHDSGLPDEYIDAYVDAGAYGLGGRAGGDLMLYSSVAPFIHWKMRVYPDALPSLRRKQGDRYEVVPDSPFLQLIARPNAQQDWVSILQATIMEMDVDGNSYWLKERNNGGNVTGIYWVRRNTIWPDRELSEAMGELYYLYTPGSGRKSGSYPVPAVDVVHHRFGIDPRDHRLGISPLRAALRDVMTDELAQRHTAALLENFASAGTLVGVDGGLGADQLEALEQKWHDKLGGRRKGRTLFVNKGINATQMTTTPKDMELSDGALPDRRARQRADRRARDRGRRRRRPAAGHLRQRRRRAAHGLAQHGAAGIARVRLGDDPPAAARFHA